MQVPEVETRFSITGIGVDVVLIERITRVRSRHDLLAHVCAPDEQVEGVDDLTAAKLWAGKEAIAKCLGSGFWQLGVDWTDVRLGPDFVVRLHGRAAELAGGDTFSLTFTQHAGHLLAVAIRRAGS